MKQDEKSKVWKWLFWILLIIIAFSLISNNSKRDYTWCIDDCIWYNYDCVSLWGTYFTDARLDNWISQDEVWYCWYELEYCVSDCEDDY